MREGLVMPDVTATADLDRADLDRADLDRRESAAAIASDGVIR
jgi:hypothetical protein